MKKILFLSILVLSACSSNVDNYVVKDEVTLSMSDYIQKALKMYGGAEPVKINALGIMYDSGFGVPKNPQKARELYLKAGKLGYGSGYCNLAASYQDDNNVKDYKKIESIIFTL
ncbi:hypothetical protein BKG91_06225 [Rodentibacter caecimuris]|uniref:Beta-lactamase n=1 Tax=Rodentibacter caecimuris TaxID=1796644 RepID=A0AAJ3N0Z7_9PAST|nr:SEL1-like repeat protein [Rodentibacter heylii]AOF53811.1 hypothetical protein AC062_1719 [Pasteurellaceae bacterium NI1060]OOF72987.1 hypothetical protein BKG90_02420 [Rodentibacter heylii]OOF74334.1 hypothetical protein BKG99_10390 [Rodentibacter heylii]OOF74434.1 hypothetical protein BKG91_06225 [Rodentibacter heylii]